jgi:hypothetical protein
MALHFVVMVGTVAVISILNDIKQVTNSVASEL